MKGTSGKKFMRKQGGKRKSKGKARMYKSVRDVASCSVTNTLEPIDANTMYVIDNTRLSDFDRAVQVAQGYQRFRMTGVKLTLKPAFDIYAQNTGGFQKPNLYYVIDKTGTLPDNITLQSLKEAGALSRVLDEKPFTIRYRPAVIAENQAWPAPPPALTFAGPSGYRTSPWLSTNQQNTNTAAWTPNLTAHLGVKFYIEQVGNNGAQAVPFYADLTVEFQFTKPSWSLQTSSPARTISYAIKDDSPDGVVGGADGA